MKHICLTILLCLALCGCVESERMKSELEKINLMCDRDARQAKVMLDSMPTDGLSEAERHHYDLLTIKAADKNFTRHVSDSLVLNVVEYYAGHKKTQIYPEALYYAGRVYSDLGDFPTALTMYRQAVEEMGDNENFINLKVRVFSQICDILKSMHLYEEALQYAHQALEADAAAGNLRHVMYDKEMLGNLNMQLCYYDKARMYYDEARDIASRMSLRDTIDHDMYIAAIEYFRGNPESALPLIRSVIRKEGKKMSNTALAYAASIYQGLHITDTAILYARKLIGSDDLSNRKTGYKILLSEDVINHLHEDSVINYVRRYRDEMNRELAMNANEAAMIQIARYNYQKHLNGKLAAETVSKQRLNWIFALIACVICLSMAVLYAIFRKRLAILRLKLSNEVVLRLLADLERQKHIISVDGRDCVDESKEEEDPHARKMPESSESSRETEKGIKETLNADVQRLLDAAGDMDEIPRTIIDSEVYARLIRHKNEVGKLDEKDCMWREIEDIVAQACPKFTYWAARLGFRRLNPTEAHVLLLIKVGMSPMDISILTGRKKPTVTYTRHCIAKKMFGKDMDTDKIDRLIRLL